MANTYYDMYTSQKGSGLAYYQGMRYQKGHGFFGRIFKSTLLPILKYFGKQALDTGADIVKDSLSGQDIKTSVKRRVKIKLRRFWRTP